MPDILKYLLTAIVPIGLIILATFAFWFVLPIFIIGIAARILYLKYFRKEKNTVHTYTFSRGWGKTTPFGKESNSSFGMENNINREYTTVIDADNMDREYRIPKMK